MYLNRLFFRADTGTFITRTYMDDGGLGGVASLPTVEEDFDANALLQQYIKDAVLVVELEKGEYEQDFNEGIIDHIDVNTKEIYFRYPDPSEPGGQTEPQIPLTEQIKSISERQDLMQKALDDVILGGAL